MDGIAALSSTVNSSDSLSRSRIALAKSATLSEKDKAKIDKVAQDFEAVFLSQMMEQMFAGVDIDPAADGPGEDIYKSMLLDEYGKIIAKSGGIGISDHIRNEMLTLQETP